MSIGQKLQIVAVIQNDIYSLSVDGTIDYWLL